MLCQKKPSKMGGVLLRMLPLNITCVLNKQIIDNIKSDVQKFSQWGSKPWFSGIINLRKLISQVKETLLCPSELHHLLF